MQEITEADFEKEILRSDVPCVIEFTASWCTLCDEMIPKLENLERKFEGKVRVFTVNLDEQQSLRIKFAVAAVPYIVYVSNGMQTPLFDEMVPEEMLVERVRFLLEGGEAPNSRPLR